MPNLTPKEIQSVKDYVSDIIQSCFNDHISDFMGDIEINHLGDPDEKFFLQETFIAEFFKSDKSIAKKMIDRLELIRSGKDEEFKKYQSLNKDGKLSFCLKEIE